MNNHLRMLLFSCVALLLITGAVGCGDIQTCTYRNLSEIYTSDFLGDATVKNTTVCVELDAGEVYNATYMSISNPVPYNFVLMGNNATVQCHNTSTIELTNYTVFPLVFQGYLTNNSVTSLSLSVMIKDVTFENCLRPLHFVQIANVTLINVHFR